MSEVESGLVPGERLEARDLKVLLVWILIGLVGAGVAFKYFYVAFPEASVDFRISRPAALEMARVFLTVQGQKPAGYESSIVFRVDDNAKTYLEREVGLKQANRLMASEVSVWYWDARLFRPQQKEEFRVRVSPAGRVAGYTHVLEEARAGARLERDAARAAAEAFLRTRYAVDLAAFDFLPEETNATERPERRDWSFSWERRGFRAKDAPYRLRVTVQGADVGGCEEFLKVPEAWTRDFQRIRSSNVFYGTAALVPYAFLNGAVLLILYELGRRGLIRWRGALKLGLVLAVLFFAMFANQLPLERSAYDTNSSYTGFFLSRAVTAALLSLGLGLLVSLTVAAAEPLYRRSQPERLRLGSAVSLRGIRSKEFFRSCVIGLAMAAGHIGFVVLFYIVGKKFGFWAPQDLNYTNAVSTAVPWIYPLTIGTYAATSEEFLFRLFAIPLLLRFARSKFVAVVVPAFVWGFLHSTYPVEPGYVRGIEVGLIGIVAGVVMLRYGILATLVWHYTVDALLVSLFLLRSESVYFRVSGAVVGAGVLIPLAISGAFYLARRRFEPEEALLNRAAPLVETSAAPAEAGAVRPSRAAYEAFAPRTLGTIIGCGAVGALLLVAVKTETIGHFVRFSVDARQAAAKADEVLRGRKINPATFRRTTTLASTFDGYSSEYLRRFVGLAGANRLYQEKVPSVFWRVRYFRDSLKEEYLVLIRPDGALHSVHHLLDEKAPGATLSKEEAQARAEIYLRDEKRLDLARWKLVEAKSEKPVTRTDHTFTWEEREAVGEAHVRIELKVLGDEVSGYRVFVKIPEEWELRQKKRTLASIVHLVGGIVLLAAAIVVVLTLFFMNLKHPAMAGVPWRRLALWALWGLLAFSATLGNNVPKLLASYQTEIPFKAFAATLMIGLFLSAAVLYSGLFFLFGLAWFFLARVFDTARFPRWGGMPAAYYRDAFWVALAGTGILLGLARLPHLLAWIWPTAGKSLEASIPFGFDSYFPAAQAIGSAISNSLFAAGVIALAAGFVAGYVRQRWLQLGLVFLTAVSLSGNWGSPADFVKKVLLQLITIAVVWWGVEQVVRFNLLGYFLLAVATALTGAAVELLRQPNEFLRANGYAVIFALAGFVAWPLIAWRRSAEESSEPLRPVA